MEPKVNMKRWGGGIPLLLSGPGAERLITSEATDKAAGDLWTQGSQNENGAYPAK
jgi:hypothetical protein